VASGTLTEWLEVTDVTDDGRVTFDAHTVFPGAEHLVHPTTLAFRTPEQLRADLARAGFAVSAMTGGWRGEPLSTTSALLVVEATATG